MLVMVGTGLSALAAKGITKKTAKHTARNILKLNILFITDIRLLYTTKSLQSNHIIHRRESFAVDFARAEIFQLLDVSGGAISFMLVKTILGILSVHLLHDPIARHLGDNAGRGNGKHF